MPTPGFEVLQTIHRSAQRALDQHNALSEQQQAQMSKIDGLVAEHGKVLEDLAKHYLPKLDSATVRSDWSDIRPQIENVLERKEQHQQQLTQQQQTLSEQHNALQRQIADIETELAQVQQQRDQLSKQMSEHLAGDADFQKLTDQAAVAEVQLQKAESSLAEVEREVIEKLPAYQQSRLFNYLYDRKMGTPHYTAKGAWRRWDRWVGKMIDYPSAKKSYEFLTQVPDRMRELIAQRRESLRVKIDQLQTRQSQYAAQLGLDVVLKRDADLSAQRQRLLQDDAQCGQQINEIRTTIDQLLDSAGPYYAEAIQLYKNLLQRSEQASLEFRALQSPEPDDDRLVAQLKELNEQIQSLHQRRETVRQQLQHAQQTLESLNELINRFRQRRFDAPRSYFDDGLEIEESLERLLDGREQLDFLWRSICRHQQEAPNWYEESSRRAASAVNSPLGQILLQTMAHAAASSLREHARRAGSRHINAMPPSPRVDRQESRPQSGGFGTRGGF